jgi:hypothetical protein
MTLWIKPPRTPWPAGFPDVVLHASESAVKQHPAYAAAKSGDADAAVALVADTVSEAAVAILQSAFGSRSPTIVSAHAFERFGVNAIPEAFASELAKRLQWQHDKGIVQSNVVGHTGASGFHRLAKQAAFLGPITRHITYVLADDFIGQGGTLANLRGYITQVGASVIGATSLTGKEFSAKLSLTAEQLATLRAKHGPALETWWIDRFGHAFDCLTQSEARYLERTRDADTVRDRIVAAEQA